MRTQTAVKALPALLLALACALAPLSPAAAGEWTNWRGPHHTGVADDTGLISSWSTGGENLIWRADFSGRSTAAVFDGRACAIGRDGEGILRQEVVVCWSAEDGKKLWERRFTPHNTFVPWQRLGWAAVAGDPETGYLFANTSDGLLIALDAKGETVWEWRTAEDFGRLSGYGGRTHTPIVDEDRVVLAAINTSWGDMGGRPSMRYWNFDKRTGEVLFAAKPSPFSKDANTQSTPVITVVDGERALIGASSDGSVYALRARTGEALWSFQVSQVSLNAGVAVAGGKVFTSHSEENVDARTMGRMVAVDLTGKESWRIPDLKAGFGTPLVHGGRVYQIDNSANLFAVDTASGEVKWTHSLGTVGKSGPVWADGKIYVTEVNGNFHILKDAGDHAEALDTEEIKMPDGARTAEIYASPAIAYGRVYFATEEGFYCLGDKSKPFVAEKSTPPQLDEKPAAPHAKPALIHVVPAEVVTTTADTPSFRVRTFDEAGHLLDETQLGERPAESWSLDGLDGEVSADGKLTLEDVHGLQVGYVVAKLGDLEGKARVRATGSLPWKEDFESLPAGPFPKGGFPAGWLGRGKKAHVEEKDGNKVLVQPDPQSFAPRAVMYIGPSLMKNYTIQADVYATVGPRGRRKPELGILNSGYTFLAAGIQQRLEIRSWGSELRMMQRQDFAWDVDTWYTMKLRVDVESDGEGRERAAVRGKMWKRSDAEPADWTFTVHDPLPIQSGAPGLYGFTPVEGYFDNVLITENK